ncbi:hypothetical protein NQ314_016327 [Rhamnusium bicolor]|uniref:Uncharacterized protein n=1 Tax=Rhamnusium bicolor TaxID=1586634 RepID=A0AAV8WXH1_9CUCU|nr:hypothetical protein NQ314_016327 [Rhamnusium bicolor]
MLMRSTKAGKVNQVRLPFLLLLNQDSKHQPLIRAFLKILPLKQVNDSDGQFQSKLHRNQQQNGSLMAKKFTKAIELTWQSTTTKYLSTYHHLCVLMLEGTH